MGVAQVIVDVAARAIDRPFDYSIPEELEATVLVGAPVLVPFGSRDVVGYVAGLTASSEHSRLKSIAAVLDEPLFSAHTLGIAQWMADHYVCPLSEALRPILPPGGTPGVRRDDTGAWRLSRPSVSAVSETWVIRDPDSQTGQIPARAVRQRAVLDATSDGPVTTSELRAQLGDVSSALTRLEDLGHVRLESRRRWRTPSHPVRSAPRHERLTEEQQRALALIEDSPDGACVVLDGVTGSGKTEVYLRAIETQLAAGKDAIVLVPEISLTPQTVGRFRSRFGEEVAVLHSRLSAGERFDQWELARSGAASVVVGPRSAIFAPLGDIGLIVIDEEHEGSYKQGSSPRYHARDVAARLADAVGAKVVLGSATPSLESRFAVEEGRYACARLTTRATGATLPDVRVVDMGGEFANGNRSMFSAALADALAGVSQRREKAVVLLNRRGYASFLLCRECGYVPECTSCSVSLTYHENGDRLTCHHCGAHSSVPAECPDCGSPYLRRFGAGTQRVESDLRAAFPDLPVVRMDADTTSGKGGHESRLAEFEALDCGVLLGTQMIAKGLDYPEVTLVGVLGADLGLRMPDFRAAERTFQLLTQVAGRAGRGDHEGIVIIQTYAPEHRAVRAAAEHDADSFYPDELGERAAHGYPPAGSLARIVLSGKDPGRVQESAISLGEALRDDCPGGTVLGPAPAPISRVRGVYRWHLLVKAQRGTDLSSPIARALATTPPVDGVSRAPDIEPYELL